MLEQLGRVQQLLPPDVSPTLGPDASGVGWVYQYVLKDGTGRMDLAELRALQDFTVRPALQAVAGVAEVASLGGFERQYQIVIDPDRLVGFGLTLGDVTRSVRDANAEVGARVLELAGREYVLRGRGYVKDARRPRAERRRPSARAARRSGSATSRASSSGRRSAAAPPTGTAPAKPSAASS